MSRLSSLRLPHKRLIFLFSFFIFFASHAFADEKENPCAKSLLNLDPPPYIREVNMQPEVPKECDDVIVRAAIGNDSEKTKAVTTNAWLHYSTDDGKTETVVEMQKTEEKDSDGFAVWTGKIPAHKIGTSVVYYVSAKDTNGHYSTETPGESANVKFTPEEGKESGIKFSAPVPDEECPSAEGGLDILGFSVGYDEKKLYFQIITRDDIKAGETKEKEVIKANVLGISIQSHAVNEDLKLGRAFFWAPLFNELSRAFDQVPNIEINKECFVIEEYITFEKLPSTSGIDCFSRGNVLFFKLDRLLLGKNQSKIVRVVVGSNQIILSDLFQPTDQKTLTDGADAAPHIYVYLRTHAYTVR